MKYINHSVGYIFHSVGYKSRTVKQRMRKYKNMFAQAAPHVFSLGKELFHHGKAPKPPLPPLSSDKSGAGRKAVTKKSIIFAAKNRKPCKLEKRFP